VNATHNYEFISLSVDNFGNFQLVYYGSLRRPLQQFLQLSQTTAHSSSPVRWPT